MPDSFLVTVVMALYHPNLKWLEEELASIEKQTFRQFQLYIWNDDPQDNYPYEAFFSLHLQHIPFKLFHGSNNMGSNKVFEKLTMLVHTPYIAYCDQDDVWLPDKLEKLLAAFDNPNVTLAFSDMVIINESSEIIAKSISEIRSRQILYSGTNVLSHLLVKNFVTGCTILLRTNIAQTATPFPQIFFHDWWLAICAAILGNIIKIDKPLVQYRIYSGNQSKILKGVNTKGYVTTNS